MLGCVLARARQGDLGAVEVLPELMVLDDGALVWNACIQLIGFAGRQSLVFDTAKRFLSNPDDLGVQWYISEMLRNACSIRAVNPLLVLYEAAMNGREDVRRHIEQCLSTVLEEEYGEVYDGPEEHKVLDPNYPEPFTQYETVWDRAGYIEKVHAVSAQVAERLASPDQPVTAGKPLDLQALVLHLCASIRLGVEIDSRVEFERMCFEASTGIDCSDLYKVEGGRQRPAALAVLEGFLDSGAAARFEIGTRYFFGHRIEP